MTVPSCFQNVPLRVKMDYSGLINLSSNEMFPNESLKRLQQTFYDENQKSVYELGKYTYIEETRSRLAEFLKVNETSLILSPGSDSAIFYLLSLLRHSFSEIYIQIPNYFNYERYACLLQYNSEAGPLDFSGFCQHMAQCQNKVVVVTNPNGMTGEAWTKDQLHELVKICAQQHHFLILDQAYSDFDDHFWITDLQDRGAIIKTYSKSYATAGLRIAYMVLAEEYAIGIKKMGLENSISRLQLEYVKFCIHHQEAFKQIHDRIIQLREDFNAWMHQSTPKFKVLNSKANFIAFQTQSPKICSTILEQLKQKSIVAKQVPEHTVRMTVPNNTIIEIVKKVLADVHSQL